MAVRTVEHWPAERGADDRKRTLPEKEEIFTDQMCPGIKTFSKGISTFMSQLD